MVAKPRLLFSAGLATTLLMTTGGTAWGAFQASDPNPLRQASLLRLQDVAVSGKNVAVGWRQGSAPGELFLAFSTNDGVSFRRTNGNLRRYRIAGEGRLGLSLDICGGKVWAASSAHFPGDAQGNTDVLVTNRVIGGGAGQAFITSPSVDRKVRDVALACVGRKYLAIAWAEQRGNKSTVKLMIRDQSLASGTFKRSFGLGPARFKGGVAVAATGNTIHVAWSKGKKQNLRYKRFEIGSGSRPSISPQKTVTAAFDKVLYPQIGTIGQKVVLAYTDAGKVKVKISTDRGATLGNARRIIGTGSAKRPSKAHSVSVSGNRIVVEATKRQNNGATTPQRLQSFDLGASAFNVASFGHNGPRMGGLKKIDNQTSVLREAWNNNGSPSDTLRAQYETP